MNLILRVLRELYVILIKILSPLFYISHRVNIIVRLTL